MVGSVAIVVLVVLVGTLIYLRLDQPQSWAELEAQLPDRLAAPIRERLAGAASESPSDGSEPSAPVESSNASTEEEGSTESGEPHRSSSDALDANADSTSSDGDGSGTNDIRTRDASPEDGSEGDTLRDDHFGGDLSTERSPSTSDATPATRDEPSPVPEASQPSDGSDDDRSDPDFDSRHDAEQSSAPPEHDSREPDSQVSREEGTGESNETDEGEEGIDEESKNNTPGFGIVQAPGSTDDEASSKRSGERSGRDNQDVIGLDRGQSRPPSSKTDDDSN
jgi:hypothetical protein